MPRTLDTNQSPSTYLRDNFVHIFRGVEFRPDPIKVYVSRSLYEALQLEYAQHTRVLLGNDTRGRLTFLDMPVEVGAFPGNNDVWEHEWLISPRPEQQIFRAATIANTTTPTRGTDGWASLSPAQQQELRRLWGAPTARRAQAQPIDETVVEVDFD